MFLTASPHIDVLLRALLLTTAALFWVVLLVRLVGLRSFSKMTNFDFVMTIATGSLLAGASQATTWSGFAQIILAMASLFLIQYVTARLRRSSPNIQKILQNKPVMLMRNGKIIEAALTQTRVARSDLLAKLREANALDLNKVQAVVLETTGDISVLHGSDRIDPILTDDVQRSRDDNS